MENLKMDKRTAMGNFFRITLYLLEHGNNDRLASIVTFRLSLSIIKSNNNEESSSDFFESEESEKSEESQDIDSSTYRRSNCKKFKKELPDEDYLPERYYDSCMITFKINFIKFSFIKIKYINCDNKFR